MLIVSGGGTKTQIYNDHDGWTVIPYQFQYGRNWVRLVTFQNRVLFLGKHLGKVSKKKYGIFHTIPHSTLFLFFFLTLK